MQPLTVLREKDPEVWQAIEDEGRRQADGLELIASENYVSPSVQAALGTVLTNKYAEGYAGRRYYGGCEFVDSVEQLAIDRAKKLFNAEHANVQPHSGSQANMAMYFGLLRPGDTFLAMDLAAGGHLSHGSRANFSGRLYQAIHYGVKQDTEQVDFDQVATLARRYKPKVILAGHSSYPRQLDFARFAEIAREIGAQFVVDMAHFAGLVAGGCHPNPMLFADVVTSTTHKTLRGPRAGFLLCRTQLAKTLDKAVFPGMQGGPFMHTIAAKAICFGEALQPQFRQYAAQVLSNARTLAEELATAGFRLITGGTDNHLISLDVRSDSRLTGRIAEEALGRAGITVNRNMIPFDERGPMDPSGIRIGTPAVTTRGMTESEMRSIGKWIAQVLTSVADPSVVGRVQGDVRALCQQFPVPGSQQAAELPTLDDDELLQLGRA